MKATPDFHVVYDNQVVVVRCELGVWVISQRFYLLSEQNLYTWNYYYYLLYCFHKMYCKVIWLMKNTSSSDRFFQIAIEGFNDEASWYVEKKNNLLLLTPSTEINAKHTLEQYKGTLWGLLQQTVETLSYQECGEWSSYDFIYKVILECVDYVQWCSLTSNTVQYNNIVLCANIALYQHCPIHWYTNLVQSTNIVQCTSTPALERPVLWGGGT